MVVKVVLLYPLPPVAERFDEMLTAEHVPNHLATIPGLTRCVLSKVLWSLGKESPFYSMAELYFPTLETVQSTLTACVAHEILDHAASISESEAVLAIVCMEEIVSLSKP